MATTPSGPSSTIAECCLDSVVGELLAVVQAFGVNTQQDFNTVASSFGDLRW